MTTLGTPQRDIALTLTLLVMLLGWDASGLDVVIAGWYGNAAGFELRNAWWTRGLLHDGGRWLSGAALAGCAVLAWRGERATRPQRLAWMGVVLACLVAVPALKRISGTSCPWDLSAFGGTVGYVPHWLLNVLDGGPGHCFPSGHAVAAFAFLPLYFQWRQQRPRLSLVVLAVVIGFGALFGWAQLARGAHFPSHVLWSAWLCWTIAVAAASGLDRAPADGIEARAAAHVKLRAAAAAAPARRAGRA